MTQRNKVVERPTVACEITAKAVFGARASRDGSVEFVHTRALPAGAVVPSLTGQNITNVAAVRDAIAETMLAVAGKTTDIIAVIPDAALRVVLLDFEALPERVEDAEPVVRFKLKKSLPFDVEKAAVSYDALPTLDGKVKVIAAVILRTVLEEYEAVYREAGCTPGVVIPSTLAALGAIDGDHPTMLLKVDSGTTSVAIVDQNHLLLFRTLENGGETSPQQLAEDVYPSIVYLQDSYGVSVERVMLAGVTNVAEFSPILTEQTGARVDEISKSALMPISGARNDAAGAIGALL